MKLSLIAAIVLALIMAFFAVQNSQPTHVAFFGWYSDGPLVIVLLLTFAAGAIAAMLAMLPGSLAKSVELSRLKSKLADTVRKTEDIEKRKEATSQPCEQRRVEFHDPTT